MLTRFVKTQLIIFTIASVIGVSAMVFVYLQAPVLLGIGRIAVTLELPTRKRVVAEHALLPFTHQDEGPADSLLLVLPRVLLQEVVQ